MALETTGIDAQQVLKSLKQILKERKISYADLSGALEVSLPTVKRMLNKPGLPLDRLFAICQIADVEVSEVIARSEAHRPRHYIFTAAQDELFFERPEFLAYFNQLTEAGRSPDQIAEKYSLSQRSTEAYLIGLARVGLLERKTGNEIRLLVAPPFGFGPGSKVLRKRQSQFIRDITGMVISNRSRKCFAILKPLRLPESVFTELTRELSALISKYAYLSEGGLGRKDPGSVDWNLSVAAGPAPARQDPGEIVNLE